MVEGGFLLGIPIIRGREAGLRGTNSENVIHAQEASPAEAWYRATLQAEAVGMLAALKWETGSSRF